MLAVGAYIAALREGRGFTQPAFAEAIGISERGLRDWEKGRSGPDVDELQKILALLQGSWLHIIQLAKADATVSRAKRLAKVAQEQPEYVREIQEALLSLPPDVLRDLGPIAERLSRELDEE